MHLSSLEAVVAVQDMVLVEVLVVIGSQHLCH
jgi:hypothetical protein